MAAPICAQMTLSAQSVSPNILLIDLSRYCTDKSYQKVPSLSKVLCNIPNLNQKKDLHPKPMLRNGVFRPHLHNWLRFQPMSWWIACTTLQ